MFRGRNGPPRAGGDEELTSAGGFRGEGNSNSVKGQCVSSRLLQNSADEKRGRGGGQRQHATSEKRQGSEDAIRSFSNLGRKGQ